MKQMVEDGDVNILIEAYRLTKGGHIPKKTWSEYNVFSGRMDEQTESDESLARRILAIARENVTKQHGRLLEN